LADPTAARQALDEIAQRLNALDVWFSEAEEQRLRWENDVRAKDLEVATIARQVERAGESLASAEAELATLEAERRVLEDTRSLQAGRIADHLAASYRMSGQDFVKLLLNQESPATLDRMVRYHRYFAKARVSALNSYQQTLDAMADNRLQLTSHRDDAAGKRDTLAKEQLVLVRQREQRKSLIEELTEEAGDKTSERTRLQADQHRLEQLLAELNRRATELDGRGFLARKGSLPWPLSGRLANGFGRPRADGRLTWHGIVVAADEGTPVKAVFRGRVVFANWLRGFGLLTIIEHGSGYMTLYGHSDILLKTVGEWVESGEIIARAGRSGGQQISGLYFEVRQEGVARDPVGWLAKR
jgi:septal ring factor EnvC (AmiA/AmiB activator)